MVKEDYVKWLCMQLKYKFSEESGMEIIEGEIYETFEFKIEKRGYVFFCEMARGKNKEEIRQDVFASILFYICEYGLRKGFIDYKQKTDNQ